MLFNEKNKDLHQIVKDHVDGGLSIVFHRYHEKGVTSYVRTSTESPLDHRSSGTRLHGQMAAEWLTRESKRTGHFRRFGDAVSMARREGDVHPRKAIIVDTMKLLANSSYGKIITKVDRHRRRIVGDGDDQEHRHVRPARTRGILPSGLRQDAHVAVLLRLDQHVPGAPSLPVLRDGHR